MAKPIRQHRENKERYSTLELVDSVEKREVLAFIMHVHQYKLQVLI